MLRATLHISALGSELAEYCPFKLMQCSGLSDSYLKCSATLCFVGLNSQHYKQPSMHCCCCPNGMLTQVAVRNIIFNGTLHIVLSPLLNSLPVVGAIQVSFSP